MPKISRKRNTIPMVATILENLFMFRYPSPWLLWGYYMRKKESVEPPTYLVPKVLGKPTQKDRCNSPRQGEKTITLSFCVNENFLGFRSQDKHNASYQYVGADMLPLQYKYTKIINRLYCGCRVFEYKKRRPRGHFLKSHFEFYMLNFAFMFQRESTTVVSIPQGA